MSKRLLLALCLVSATTAYAQMGPEEDISQEPAYATQSAEIAANGGTGEELSDEEIAIQKGKEEGKTKWQVLKERAKDKILKSKTSLRAAEDKLKLAAKKLEDKKNIKISFRAKKHQEEVAELQKKYDQLKSEVEAQKGVVELAEEQHAQVFADEKIEVAQQEELKKKDLEAIEQTERQIESDPNHGFKLETCKWFEHIPRKVLHGPKSSCDKNRVQICMGYVVCEADNGKSFTRMSTCRASLCGDGDAVKCTEDKAYFSSVPKGEVRSTVSKELRGNLSSGSQQ